MTTVWLAQRLSRHLEGGIFSDLNADVKRSIAEAITAGLNLLYSALPETYRRSQYSHTIKPARTGVSLTASAQYSNQMSGAPFLADERWCTIRIAGQNRDNVITSTSTLFYDWLAEGLEATATIYYDAAAFPSNFMQMSTAPRLLDEQGHLWELVRDENMTADRSRVHLDGGIIAPTAFARGKKSVARPVGYRIEPTGLSIGAQPGFLLRVNPLPSGVYTLEWEGEGAPDSVAYQDLSIPVVLPIREDWGESILAPICERQLMSSAARYWTGSPQAVMEIRTNSDKAERLLAGLRQSPDLASGNYAIGTPYGF